MAPFDDDLTPTLNDMNVECCIFPPDMPNRNGSNRSSDNNRYPNNGNNNGNNRVNPDNGNVDFGNNGNNNGNNRVPPNNGNVDFGNNSGNNNGNNNGNNTNNGGMPDNMSNFYTYPLAMSYVPYQEWQNTYSGEEALQKGTLFPELYLPFLGGGGK